MGIKLNHIKQGHGPILVLSHALGCDLHMWDEVAQELQSQYTVLRYDHRCHGKSDCPAGPFSMDDMADDVAALIKEQAQGPVLFAGLSLGGMVAQSLAARHPQLVKAIVIANSTAYYEDHSIWKSRIETVTRDGVAPIVDGSIARWFTPEFVASGAGQARVERIKKTLQSCDPKGYVASCGAVSTIDYRESNKSVKCPTLIISGSKDMGTPPAMSQAMHAQIPGSKLVSIDAAHLSAVEQPAQFAQLMKDFLGSL